MAASTAIAVAASSARPNSPCSTARTALFTTIPPAPTRTNRRTRGDLGRESGRSLVGGMADLLGRAVLPPPSGPGGADASRHGGDQTPPFGLPRSGEVRIPSRTRSAEPFAAQRIRVPWKDVSRRAVLTWGR